jgi:hypothetical protein
MELTLTRSVFTDKSTIGKLYVDGVFECHTLEDVVRDVKIAHETAIPEGRYPVKLDTSPKFGKDIPHVANVKGFTDILIHNGNTPEQTWGCILVGQSTAPNFVGNSKAALKALVAKLKVAKGQIWLTVGH